MPMIYIAGSLFNEADIDRRIKERLLIEDALKEVGRLEEFSIYNPIEAPVNDKASLPTAEEIFRMDREHLMNSDIMIVDISTLDLGVAMEIGMFLEGQPNGYIIAHNSDIRIDTANRYSGNRVPYGQNQFLVGGLLDSGFSIHASFDGVLKDLKLFI